MTAVNQNGEALVFTSEYIRRDREIVMAAIRQKGGTLDFAAEDLW